ncbi:uncharacterized protein TNCV_3893431 [Trichonephila clavipes]|nr:uncharacterized protein TNCV_3893431 [Trichonephila clavipes]
MRSVGKGEAAAKVFCGVMNLPPPPKRFYESLHALNNATEKIAKVSMALAAAETLSFNNGNPNVPVAIDALQEADHARIRKAEKAISMKNKARIKNRQLKYRQEDDLADDPSNPSYGSGDIEILFDKARRNTKSKQEKWAKYFDKRMRDVQINVNDWVLMKTHSLSSATKKVVIEFKPKLEGPFRILEYGRKEGPRVKHELEEQGISFKKYQDERHTGTTLRHGPLVRPPPGFWSEPNRKVKMGRKETVACKRSLNSGSGRPEED